MKAAALRDAPEVKQASEETHYAQELATSLWKKHYGGAATQWLVMPDLMGALSQIDNITSGLTRAARSPVAAPQPDVSASDAKQLVDNWMYAFDVKLSGPTYDALRDCITTRAAPTSAEPYALPQFIIDKVERAIHDAQQPKGMHTNGPCMARLDVTHLQRLLIAARAAMQTAEPNKEAQND